MSYRNTDKPDSSTVQLTLTIGQIKTLNRLVESDLVDAEQYGESMVTQKKLEKLSDVFFPILNIKLTEDEEKAHIRAWRIAVAKKELEKLCPES